MTTEASNPFLEDDDEEIALPMLSEDEISQLSSGFFPHKDISSKNEESFETSNEEDSFDEWDLDETLSQTFSEEEAKEEIAAESESPSLEDFLNEDWGFVEETDTGPNLTAHEEPEENPWGDEFNFDEESESSSELTPQSPEDEHAIIEEITSEDTDDSLSSFLDNLSEATPDEEPLEEKTENSENKSKFKDLIKQIKSELKGGEENNDPSDKPPVEKKTEKDSLFARLTTPLAKLVLLLLKPLTLIPGVGSKLDNALKPNLLFRLIGILLPLLLVILILQWHSSRPLAQPKQLTFPDGGAATISQFSYDSDDKKATAVITNKGDVIANVTPTIILYSLQPSLNPLSLFYAKPEKPCVGEEVEVQIEEKKTIVINCDSSGRVKKMTGKLTW